MVSFCVDCIIQISMFQSDRCGFFGKKDLSTSFLILPAQAIFDTLSGLVPDFVIISRAISIQSQRSSDVTIVSFRVG